MKLSFKHIVGRIINHKAKIGSILKFLLLQCAFFAMQFGNVYLSWAIIGSILLYIVVSFSIKIHYLSSLHNVGSKEEIIELGGKYQLLKRRTTLYLINLICCFILIASLHNFYLQQFFILAFLFGDIGIYRNSFNSNFQFRVLYGLEIYLMFITITALYTLVYYQYLPIPLLLLPIFVLFITYFSFDYLLMKRKHRIYTIHCIHCRFRLVRKRYILGYSIITTLFFLILIYTKIDVITSSLILTIVMNIMRNFTCDNFNYNVSKEIKMSYIYILAILLLIAFSTISIDTDGRIGPSGSGDNIIIKDT